MCNKTFSFELNWAIHVRKHPGGKPYLCDQCDESFHVKYELSEHIKRHSTDVNVAI